MQSSSLLSRRGFTLVELLVVIAIIGLLVAMLLPAVNSARESARRNQCQNNVRQLAFAMQLHDNTKKKLPPGMTKECNYYYFSGSGFVYALPFHEEQQLYERWDFKKAAISEPNLAVASTPVPIHMCPSSIPERNSAATDCDTWGAPTSYALCTGTNYRPAKNDPPEKKDNGVFVTCGERFDRVSIDRVSNADGASHTIMLGEMGYSIHDLGVSDGHAQICYQGGMTSWAKGYPGMGIGSTAGVFNAKFSAEDKGFQNFRSTHSGGAFLALVDGSVHFVSDTINADTLDALATREGKENIDMKSALGGN